MTSRRCAAASATPARRPPNCSRLLRCRNPFSEFPAPPPIARLQCVVERPRANRRGNHKGSAVTMSTSAALPPPLRDKLASLSRRLRLLRAVRGLSWLLLLRTVTGGAALLADHFLSLSAPVRVALLTGWMTLGVVTTSVGLLGPLFRRIDP